jgi:hypothetical protein
MMQLIIGCCIQWSILLVVWPILWYTCFVLRSEHGLRPNNVLYDQVELTTGACKETDDAAGHWLRHTVEHLAGGLANLVVHLLCSPFQSATCERLFKEDPFFHTKQHT